MADELKFDDVAAAVKAEVAPTPAPTPAPAPAAAKVVPLVDLIDLESGQLPDPTHVFNKDPNFHYTWLSVSTHRLEYNKMYFGYELVGKDAKESVISPPNALGERRLGDVVLAKIPIERYKRLVEAHAKRTQNAMDAATERWRIAVEGAGMEVVGGVKVQKKEGM